jgi:hypothetical protein
VARWAFVLTDTAGKKIGELTAAKGRKLTARLSSPSEASFTIDGRHRQAAEIAERRTDLIVYRNGVKVFRGRVGAAQDQAGPDRHTVSPVTALDYRAVLDPRLTFTALTFTGVDQSAIAWALITDTQGRTGGNLGITRGLGQTTGVLRDRTYEAGKSVGELITQLSEVINGFDWDITPDLKFDVHYPQRGTDRGVVLDYGGTVKTFSRTPGQYANVVRVSGADGVAPVVREVADLATRPEGRVEAQFGFPDVTQAATLAQKADRLLAELSAAEPSYTVTLKTWGGPGELWLGDPVELVVKTGRLDEVSVRRVVEVDVDVDDSGVETVQVSLGQPSLRTRHLRRTNDVQRRLTELERR